MAPTVLLQPTAGRPLRVLALVTDAYGSGGGIAQYNRDLFRTLSECDQVGEVVVLPRSGKSVDVLPGGIRQLAPAEGRVRYALAAYEASRTDGPFDIVFCGHLYMVPLAAWLASRTKARLWLQLHGIEAWQCPSLLVRKAAERADCVTAVSRHTRRAFLGWNRLAPNRVKVLPNTVDERFCPTQETARPAALDGLEGKKLLLTVSRLSSKEQYKGHDQVIFALDRLRSSHPDLAYVIAGEGDDRQRLEALAREVNVANQVRFVGHVHERDLPDLFRSADVFVMPSTGEGFGIVFLQALACGLAVIGGNVDGSVDPLRDGLDGTLVAPGDVEKLGRAISEVLEAKREARQGGDSFSRPRFQRHARELVAGLAA